MLKSFALTCNMAYDLKKWILSLSAPGFGRERTIFFIWSPDPSNFQQFCRENGDTPWAGQVIPHQVITGEQGKKYCETCRSLSNAMIRNSQEACRSRKQILRVLIYHVKTVHILLKLKCYIE